MLARLQRITLLSQLALIGVWMAFWWARSPTWAWVGAGLFILAHPLWLALEFVALARLSRSDPSPRPGAAQLARAWLGETAMTLRVFCWRQPFRAQAVTDQLPAKPDGRRGVVLIHGFLCNRGFWTPWMRRLREAGVAFEAVNLEPVFGPLDGYVPQVEAAVRRMSAATGQPPVLLCHSMGGLVARAWLRAQDGAAGDARVRHVITIGTPHHGTWLARLSRTPSGRQMRLDSDWLRELAQSEPPQRQTRLTCWYSNCDNIVFPPSTATLPGADNRLQPGWGHVHLAFAPQVMATSLALITAP